MWAALLVVSTSCGVAEVSSRPLEGLAPGAPPIPRERVSPTLASATPLPDPTTATEVALDELLAWADEHAPAISLARARSQYGAAAVEAASPRFPENPELEGGIGGRTVGGETFLEAEVSISQRVEIAGERSLRMDAAERTREHLAGRVDESRWEVHAQVHALFVEALVDAERVTAARAEVSFAEDVLEISQRRVAAGEDASLVLLVAESELAQARSRVVDAGRRLGTTRLLLAETAGWPAEWLPPLTGELPPVRRTRPLDTLIALTAEHHPSLRVRALAVAEAEARARAADRDARPEPIFGLSYGREGAASDPANIWLVTLGIPLPLWQRNQGERARAHADLDVATAEAEALFSVWRTRLIRAAANVNGAAETAEIYGSDVLPTIEENLDLIRRAYELGELDIQAVSQTRERVLETLTQALAARGAYVGALTELEALLGTEVDQALEERR